MGELGANKIIGALLAIGLAVLGLRELSSAVFGGGHHGDHHYESLNEWAEASFPGYRMEMAEAVSSGPVVEEIYDLGLMMAGAEMSQGERSFKGKCASCHSIEQGGVNGTGPNLFAVVGAPKQHVDGFGYSGALASVGGAWTYENLDAWLAAPSKYARGTNMAFAGISRDDERASVIAYLASYTPDAPPFPAPLAAGDAAAGIPAIETAAEIVEDAGETTAIDAVVEETAAAVEAVTDTIEATTEATVDAPVTPEPAPAAQD